MLGRTAHDVLGPARVEAVEEDTGLAQPLARYVPALVAQPLGWHLGRLVEVEALGGVDDVEDGQGVYGLEILEELAGVASICIRRVDTLRGEVEQALEVCVLFMRTVSAMSSAL